jgi:hypothetical protein
MAITNNTYTGNGSNKLFSITFPYLDTTDIDVYLNGTLQTITTHYFFANATTIEFVTAPANGVSVRIQRDTDNTGNKATFFPGSSIRAADLNENFDQALYVRQELIDTGWNNTDQTLESVETWVSSDAYIATTQSIDQRVDFKIDTALTSDVFGSDGVSITDNSPGSGQITVGLTAGSVDFDRIKAEDVITVAEQTAQLPSWGDAYIATAGAIAERHDVIVSTTQPTTTQVGKQWLNITPGNQEHRIYDGSSWRLVAVGQPFSPAVATIVRYVDATNGSDAVDVTGFLPQAPLRSIKRAVDLINTNAGDGSLIVVAPGVYQETLPIQIQRENVSIVGTALRSCFVQPTQATETNTMFEVNSGTLLANMTFVGLKASGTAGANALDPGATYGLPTNQGWAIAFYNNAFIKKSPYIQNCTNFADSGIDNSIQYNQTNLPLAALGGDQTSAATGGGLLIDGDVPIITSPLRSMVVDSFTQILLNGPGVLCTNNGYAQLVSFFGTFCKYHAKALNGGQVNLSNCTTDFGEYGLIADGKSPTNIFTATANGTTNAGQITFTISATTPDASWHGDQTNPRPLDNMLVQIGGNANGTGGTIYPILSSAINGAGYDVTISNPDPNDLSINLGLIAQLTNGTTVRFFLRSIISTGGHTFEYVGSGTDYRGLPDYGGVAVEANQVKNLNNGKVWQSSTDQNGKFKVGDTFIVDQKTGVVTIPAAASSGVQKTSAVGSAIIPTGTTVQRDAAPSAGFFRFNSTDGSFEGYNGTTWGSVGGISDGDKGDITVSSSGTVWTIDNGVVSLSKLSATGTASASTFLRGDNSWATVSVSPGGSDTQIQFNDSGAFGGDADLTWNKSTNVLGVAGDVTLNDGGTFTTTIQTVTATANRTISFPNATGTVALVAGSSGQVTYNNAGAQAGGNLGYNATTGVFGYVSGTGTITQATNKATGVTLNSPSGQITLNGAALAANTTVSFTLTNSSITANDILILNHLSAGTAGSYLLNAQAGAGLASINVRNITAGSLSEAIVIGFAVIKTP